MGGRLFTGARAACRQLHHWRKQRPSPDKEETHHSLSCSFSVHGKMQAGPVSCKSCTDGRDCSKFLNAASFPTLWLSRWQCFLSFGDATLLSNLEHLPWIPHWSDAIVCCGLLEITPKRAPAADFLRDTSYTHLQSRIFWRWKYTVRDPRTWIAGTPQMLGLVMEWNPT